VGVGRGRAALLFISRIEVCAFMSLFARTMYRLLLWKERQRALRLRQGGKVRDAAGEHLDTGARGETLAYWYLRREGYTIVARNRRARSVDGEVDLIGWDGPVLAFVEVKTRTSDAAGPPEAAVSQGKQKRVARAAKEYLRQLRHSRVNYRFDVVSIFWEPDRGYRVRLIKNAYKG
jgi:putative endonuclease